MGRTQGAGQRWCGGVCTRTPMLVFSLPLYTAAVASLLQANSSGGKQTPPAQPRGSSAATAHHAMLALLSVWRSLKLCTRRPRPGGRTTLSTGLGRTRAAPAADDAAAVPAAPSALLPAAPADARARPRLDLRCGQLDLVSRLRGTCPTPVFLPLLDVAENRAWSPKL